MSPTAVLFLFHKKKSRQMHHNLPLKHGIAATKPSLSFVTFST